jgi:hypothetical protein
MRRILCAGCVCVCVCVPYERNTLCESQGANLRHRANYSSVMVRCKICGIADGRQATGESLFGAHMEYTAKGAFVQKFIRD